MTEPSPLLDLPAFSAEGYARLADRIGRLLRTKSDILLVQGEAIVALEAIATSIASPTVSALNIVTSPYGRWFGDWLRRGGARVADVTAQPAKPISIDAVAVALDTTPGVNLVSLVHPRAESSIPCPRLRAWRRRAAPPSCSMPWHRSAPRYPLASQPST